MIAVEETQPETKPSPGPEPAVTALPTGSGLGGKLSNGITYEAAIVALAQDIQELKAKLSVQPLPNQSGSRLGIVEKIIEALTVGMSKIGPLATGGDEIGKRATDLLFRLGEANLNNTLILNRRLSQTLGEQALREATPSHVVAQG